MINLQDDPLSMLRLNQLDMTPDNVPDSDFVRNSVGDVASQINKRNTEIPATGFDFIPKTTAQDTFNALINNQPIEKPHGALHHIAAAIVGAGLGSDAANNFSHGQHEREMGDWLTKAKLSQQSAQDENQSNNIGKTLAIEAGKNEDRDAKLAQQADEFARRQAERDKRAETYATHIANLSVKHQDELDLANRKLKLAQDVATGKIVGIKQDKSGQWNGLTADGKTVPYDVTGFTPEELATFKAEETRKTNEARPGASTAGTSVFQPMDQETGKPLAPVIVNRATATTKPITGPDGQPIAPGKVQTPDNQFKNQVMTFGKFVNDPHINEQFASVGKKPGDFFKTDPASGQLVGMKDRKEFTDPNDLKLYDYIYSYFNKGKK